MCEDIMFLRESSPVFHWCLHDMDVYSVSNKEGLEEEIRIHPVGVEPMTFWPQLFKSWIALSNG